MSYQLLAEKDGIQNLRLLHERFSTIKLIEFFPVEIGPQVWALGISIPFKSIDDSQFQNELENVISYLVTDQGFQVTDLYTGTALSSADVSDLAERISR